MRWSKAILSCEKANQVVLEYEPTKFDLSTPSGAQDYIETKAHGTDFRISDVVSQQTGVAEFEQINQERMVEEKALEKLKELQEAAYKEAYSLGIEEGTNKAFNEAEKTLKEKVGGLESVIHSLAKIKTDLISHNESHLIQLLFQMASKLTLTHFESQPEALLEIMKNSLLLAQDEERVIVHISESQVEFLEEVKKRGVREFEFLEKIKISGRKDITQGGCIVETNYGVVDSRIEERINQLWKNVKELLPVVKDQIVADKSNE